MDFYSPRTSNYNPLFVKHLSIGNREIEYLEDIVVKCKNLEQLEIGVGKYDVLYHENGAIWDGRVSINDALANDYNLYGNIHGRVEPPSDEIFELNTRIVAANCHKLKKLRLGSLVVTERQKSPATLEHLTRLEELRISPMNTLCISWVTSGYDGDYERDIRILAQSSTELKALDLRGCYMEYLSLGWLKTERLESLHLFYKPPGVSVLFKWAKTLKYLTLAKISYSYRLFRMRSPKDAYIELEDCLEIFSKVPEPALMQLDIRQSSCHLQPLVDLVKNCKKLTYIDTRDCELLPVSYRVQLTRRCDIEFLFKE